MNVTKSLPRAGLPLLLLLVATAAISGVLGAVIATRLAAPAAPLVEAAPVETWTCPMHPTIVQDHPGDCPICGMKLVRVDDAETSAGGAHGPGEVDAGHLEPGHPDRAEIEIDPRRQQLIGLRTVAIDRGPVGASLRTYGRLAVDETRTRRVTMKVPGYVERLHADFLGKEIRRGQTLFSLYSPEILAAEEELLLARRSGGGASEAAARRKLQLWDVPESELARLEREGTASRSVPFPSPVSGVVTRKDVVEGARLALGDAPLELTDLSTVWLFAELFEPELRRISLGDRATIRLPALPDRTLEAEVQFIDPRLDPRTRSARVRFALPNPDGLLRPDMYAEVTLHRPTREVLRVPTDALIPAGDAALVFVALGAGRFGPRRVTVGERGREFAEVTSGLAAGELVVTQANFLVDSESSLRASLARLGGATPAPAPAPDAHEAHR